MRKLILFISIMSLILTYTYQPYADDTDLFTTSVQPEALIILDMSGSMNWDISGTSTPPAPNRRIDIARNVIYDLLDDNDDGKNSDNNPIYINAADEESLNVRLGYMRFRGVGAADNDDGNPMTGKIKVFRNETEIGSSYNSIWGRVSDPDETATGCTPLAASLVEGKIYYHDEVNRKDAALACRQKFIILITDGSDTVGCGGNCAEDLPPPSFSPRRFLTVLRAKELFSPMPKTPPDPYEVPIQVFAIGFGGSMPEELKRTLNWVAKHGGTNNPLEGDSGDPNAYDVTKYVQTDLCSVTDPNADPANYPLSGYAFLAEDASQLSKALKAILKYIKEESYSYTAPSVPAVRIVEGDVMYISSFTPKDNPFWQGNLKAHPLLIKDGNIIGISDPLWDASDKLKEKFHGDRKIYTYLGGPEKEEFKTNNTNLTKEVLGVTTPEDRNKLIEHVRGGMDVYDVNQNGRTDELRDWKLGDIFHSNAVIVGEPSRFFEDDCFDKCPAPDMRKSFYQVNKDRTKVIIVGANDGMLHAFNANSGVEEWAYIPNSLLKNLQSMTAAHTYYVDGSPKVADVWYSDENGDGKKDPDEWRTILICGLRKGGKHYFALDITNTLNPTYLWEFPKPGDSATLEKLGQSWSEPAIGRVKIKKESQTVEKWVAFIGGGFDNAHASGKAFFVIDISTGEIIKEFSFSELPRMDFSLAAPPMAVDTNFNGYVDRIYIGDLAGQMWVFDVLSDDLLKWTGKRLFASPGVPVEKHPMYYQPAVAFDKRGTPWVYFGTGDRENPTNTSSQERFYAVKDDGMDPYPRHEGNLKDVTVYKDETFKTPEDPPYKGWYVKLAKSEKVLAKPSVFYNLLYFTTYTYTSTDPCKAAGEARLYVAEYRSGGGALVVDDYLQGKPSARSEHIGEGIPSAPVVSVYLKLKGKVSVVIGTTVDKIIPKEAISPGTYKDIIYWREIIR